MSGLRVFDLAGLERDFAAGGQQAADAQSALRAALCEQGLFYIGNVGVDVEAMAAAVRDATEPTMNLPEEEVEHFTRLPLRGLARDGAESTAAVVGRGSYADLCAKWTYTSKDDDMVPPGGADAWAAAYGAWDTVAVRLLVLIGEALGLAGAQRWEDLLATSRGEAILRFLRYPDVPAHRAADASENPERMAPHHDLDVVTLVHQTPCANGFVSLQGWINEEWVDVPARTGFLVVNFGEALSMMSGGAVKATLHRVVSPPSNKLEGSARRSLIMFWQPYPTFVMKPLADSTFLHLNDGEDLQFGEWLTKAIGVLRERSGADAGGRGEGDAAACNPTPLGGEAPQGKKAEQVV